MVQTRETALEIDHDKVAELAQSVAERVAGVLERAIVEGRYRPGYRLREVELAAHLGVSRTPLREAFYILEKKGLLSIVPRRGVYVKRITPQDLESLLTIRVALEGLAAGLAARNATAQQARRLRDLVRAQQQALDRGDTKAFHAFGQRLHHLIYAASANPRLAAMCHSLGVEGALFPVADILLPGEMAETMGEHRRLVAAIAANDQEQARAVAEGHIERVKARLQQFLDSEDRAAATRRGDQGA
jgi:DNA-binding GntR family transcriptional regulator